MSSSLISAKGAVKINPLIQVHRAEDEGKEGSKAVKGGHCR